MGKGIAVHLVGVLSLVLAASVQAADSKWYEYQSDNFTLHTDLNEVAARRMLSDFETFRKGVLYSLNFPDTPENSRLRIMVYGSNRDYNAIRPAQDYIGFFFAARSGPRMVIGPSRGASKAQVLYHEYIHYLLEEHVRLPVPRWYNEGYAELFSGTDIERGRFETGKMDDGRLAVVGNFGLLSLEQLFDPFNEEASDIFMARYYATAGLFMHFLQVGPLVSEEDLRRGLAVFLYNLNEGMNPVDAVEPSFGITMNELTRRFRGYVLRERYQFTRIELPAYEGEVRSRRLSTNEAAALLADMAVHLGKEDVALDYLKDLDESRPDAARGLATRALIHGHKDAIDASAQARDLALRMGSDNSEVLAELAHLYLDDYTRTTNAGNADASLLDQAMKHAKTAAELDPANLVAHDYQARVLRVMGQHGEALRSMMAMYQRFPTSLQVNSEIGGYLLELSRPDLARPFFERVYNWAHDASVMQQVKKTLDEIDAALVAEEE